MKANSVALVLYKGKLDGILHSIKRLDGSCSESVLTNVPRTQTRYGSGIKMIQSRPMFISFISDQRGSGSVTPCDSQYYLNAFLDPICSMEISIRFNTFKWADLTLTSVGCRNKTLTHVFFLFSNAGLEYVTQSWASRGFVVSKSVEPGNGSSIGGCKTRIQIPRDFHDLIQFKIFNDNFNIQWQSWDWIWILDPPLQTT